MTLRVTALDDSQDLAQFRCGNPKLDMWLCDHARQAKGQGTRTYVLLDDKGKVAGYFAIVPHVLDRGDTPKQLGRGAPRQIPAILLAKLALDERLHGRGLGAELLVNALTMIVEAARLAGGKLIVVDEIDDNAARFYRHHDFEPLPKGRNRLVMKISTAARALDLDWP